MTKTEELLAELVEACTLIGYATSGQERSNHRRRAERAEKELRSLLSSPPETATPQSLRAFASPDALGSYCINTAHKRNCNEWLVAYELLYGRGMNRDEGKKS